jgi:coenzyme F420-reducing hydrogenase delta subunit/Pyruvate/2-oxoacid:ferredoxin oxidoreductase delta subunit
MGVNDEAVATMKAWPFTKKAFVWAIGPYGMGVADMLAGFSIPVIVFQSGNGEAGDRGGEPACAGGLVSLVRGEEILKIEGHFGQFRIRGREKDGGVTEWEAGFVLIVRENRSPETKGNWISLPETNVLTTDELEALASSRESNGVPDSLGVWLDPNEGLPDRALAERALRAVLRMKTHGNPDCFVLSRHVPLWGLEGQALYDELRDKGVRFLRLGAERPTLKAADGRVELEVRDRTISDQAVRLQLDRLLVVGQPSPPARAGEIALCVGDPLDSEGFLQKDNAHLYPSRSFRKGIYYVGPCKGEQAEEELVEEVGAILPEVLAPIASGETKAPEGIRIDKGHCVSCLTCYRVCPHHAIGISHGPTPIPVDPACQGCGLCAALCPGNAIELAQRPGRQILNELEDVCSGPNDSTRTVLFCCSRSGLDPDQTSFIEVPCACSVSEEMLLAAFLKGAEKVLVVGCHPDNCVSQKGSAVGEKRTRRVARYLAATGRDPGGCIRFVAAAPNETHRLSHVLSNLDQDLSGPSAGPVTVSSEGETS